MHRYTFRFYYPAILLACLFGLLLFPGPRTGWAGPDEEGPIHIEADRMESEAQEAVLRFFGHVEAKQGKVVIFADRMSVRYASQDRKGSGNGGHREVEALVAEGNVKITKGEWVATGESLEYDAAEKKVVLTGDAKVWQEDNLVKGERVAMYLEDGRTVVERSAGERVRAFIYPEARSDGEP